MTKILDKINKPSDLKLLTKNDLKGLSAEIRDYLVEVVSKNGGHLSSSLGAVELTVALHYIYQCPEDKIIWDVGHQSYAHKLLTERKDCFHTLRQLEGLSGFPRREESCYDAFGTGHSSTSISAALGLAEARDLRGESHKVVAVIGDGALTGGMSYEGMNHAGELGQDLTVILNDNNMSIGSNVGSMSAYLGRIRSNPRYIRMKEKITAFLHKIPFIGPAIARATSRIKLGFKYFVVPGIIFEELGFTYLGPVDGHDINSLLTVLSRAREMEGPVLIHVLTQKGKGYIYAEEEPAQFHGVGPFDLNNGIFSGVKKKVPTYTDVFGETVVDLAKENPAVVAITAAMASGTGLDLFRDKFPRRFYDVGIAEQHAVTMAAGLAAGGMRPVVAVYSTFMQRAYDQALHDLGVQELPVVICLDRAGIVGNDGETHQGIFDISYLRHIPNFSIMAPKDENELRHMLKTALHYDGGPVAIRYPRAVGENLAPEKPELLPWGKSELLREGEDVLIIAAGSMVYPAVKVADRLLIEGVRAAVINARFIKPLDADCILNLAAKCGFVITVEENILAGGFGSACMELFEENDLSVSVKRLGIDDNFVKHGTRKELLKIHGLDEEYIYQAALSSAITRGKSFDSREIFDRSLHRQ